MKYLIALTVLIGTSGCAVMPKSWDCAWASQPAEILACSTPENDQEIRERAGLLPTDSREIGAYLNKKVGKKTIKKWDKYVSDDVIIVEEVSPGVWKSR